MDIQLDKSWNNFLKEEFEKDYFQKLLSFVKEEYQSKTIFPPADKIFAAFDYCDLNDLNVVILGQDPYHGAGQANGLCFSVEDGVKLPPSLKNIFKEIDAEYRCGIPKSGDLSRWAKQGILMLNATLTVEEKKPGSHQKQGWETFTDTLIKLISDRKEKVIFVLWGAYAQKKAELIDSDKHIVLSSAHPSPFSAHRGFFGNNHFKLINEQLSKMGKSEIVW